MDPTGVEVTPKAGRWVEAARLRSAVKNAGFKPGVIRYTVTGTLMEWQGQPALRVTGSERVVVLQQAEAPEAFERARQALPQAEGKTAEVEGQFVDRAVAADKKSPAALRVQRMEIDS
jgi:hypothetical protein